MAFSVPAFLQVVTGRRSPRQNPSEFVASALSGDARRAARLLRALNQDVASRGPASDSRPVGTRLPGVAIIPRPLFTDDARSVAAEMGFERVLQLDRRHFKMMAGALLPVGANNMTYRRLTTSDPESLHKYRDFLAAMWRHFDPAGDVRLVLTGNSCYWAEVEFGAALEQLDVPFVALHKENLKSPGHGARWESVYREDRAAFRGRAIFVHNRQERDLHVRGDVVPDDRIEVVGMARLDGFHAHRRSTAGQIISGDLVFAGFLPAATLPHPDKHHGKQPGRSAVLGLPLPDPEERPEHLVEACLAFHRVAVEVARRLPERRVVLKTKGRDRDPTWFPRIIDHVAGPGGPPPNLVIVHGGDAAHMTRTAAMVIGFNTTMLLEAVAAGRPAVVLALGEAAGVMQNYVLDLRGAATVIEDEAQAADRIIELVAEPRTVPAELPESARDVLERWTGNSDGRATDRTVAALRGRMHSRTARTTGADGLG
jgi:hypothetical protein